MLTKFSNSAAFRWAAREGLIRYTPIEAVKAPQPKRQRKVIQSPPEVERLIRLMAPRWQPFFRLLYETAARPIELMRAQVPNLQVAEVLDGCGHWTQQERPAEVNALLIPWLKGLRG